MVVELMTHETSVKNAIGYFAPNRMKDDYDGVVASFGDVKPFDINAAYTNDYLDMSIKMPKSGL